MSTEVHFRMVEAASQLALGDIERLVLCMNIFYLGCLQESSRSVSGALHTTR